MKVKITTFLACLFLLTVQSCKKENLTPNPVNGPGPEYSLRTNSWYFPYKYASSNGSTVNTSDAMALNSATAVTTSAASCNSTYKSGLVMKMTYYDKSTGNFTFEISLASNAAFGYAGTVYMRSSTACGSSLASFSISKTDKSKSISIKPSFTYPSYGDYVATLELSNGTKYYTSTVRILAQPENWGDKLDTYNGVDVFSNGIGAYSGNSTTVETGSGQGYQCVEFIVRYYKLKFSKDIRGGDAIDYWTNASKKGLTSYANGGTTAPKAGDIVVFANSGNGHVGIIGTGAPTGKIRVYQQNVGTPSCYSYQDMPISGNKIDPTKQLGASYTTKGWLRL